MQQRAGRNKNVWNSLAAFVVFPPFLRRPFCIEFSKSENFKLRRNINSPLFFSVPLLPSLAVITHFLCTTASPSTSEVTKHVFCSANDAIVCVCIRGVYYAQYVEANTHTRTVYYEQELLSKEAGPSARSK